MFQKELPLVAFLEQETFAFFTPGFPLQSGLRIYGKKKHSLLRFLCNFNHLIIEIKVKFKSIGKLKIRFYLRLYEVNPSYQC
jgi:hypothetical protein